MQLKLSEAALANLYPTGAKKAVKKTFLDQLQIEIQEGEVITVADDDLAAAYVKSGLLVSADEPKKKAKES